MSDKEYKELQGVVLFVIGCVLMIIGAAHNPIIDRVQSLSLILGATCLLTFFLGLKK